MRVTDVKVAVISLEPWDEVWRRNQFLASALVRIGLVSDLIFVNPAGRPAEREVEPRLRVMTPELVLPKRGGGLRVLGRRLAKTVLSDRDVIWVNDPTLGVHASRGRREVVYDVTDDWRWFESPHRIWQRVVRAEDELASRSQVVVCSDELRRRWRLRYGLDAHLVQNGVDAPAWLSARPRELPGPPPRVGYVGTLHDERLNLDLIEELAARPEIGSVHLIGPDLLSEPSRRRLSGLSKLRLSGSVAGGVVPDITVSLDVLICPHLVTAFTSSLDAIKSHEYLASGRPVVATPTSGFQHLRAERLAVVGTENFADAVVTGLKRPREPQATIAGSWEQRARCFARILDSVA